MMQYERIKNPVEAIRLAKPINDAYGSRIEAGWWLVIEGNEQTFMSDEAFRKEFRQVGTVTTEETWLKGNPCTLLGVRHYPAADDPEPYRVNVCDQGGVISPSLA